MTRLNDIKKSVKNHMFLLDKIHEFSVTLLEATQKNDEDTIFHYAENRDRMINDLYNMQSRICDKLDQVPAQLLTPVLIEELKYWNTYLNKRIGEIDNIDQEIIHLLEEKKEEVTKEIAKVFQNRKSISGYNLDSVKRK